MAIRLSFILLISIFFNKSWGMGFPMVGTLNTSRMTTTDGFEIERLGVGIKPLNDLNWPYQSESASGKSLGGDLLYGENKDKFNRAHFFQMNVYGVIKKSSKFSYTPILGLTYLKNDDDGSRVTPYAGANFDFKLPTLYLRYGILQKSQVDTLVGNTRPLYDNDGLNNILNISYNPHKRVFLRTRNTTGHWKDGGNRFLTDNSLLYGVSVGDRWFLIGPGFSYLTYNQRNPDYWSPKYFRSYGLQAELALPLVSKLSFKAGGSLNKFQEEDFEEGEGHYVRGGFFYGVREKKMYSFEIESNQSKQRDNIWRSTNIILNVQIPL